MRLEELLATALSDGGRTTRALVSSVKAAGGHGVSRAAIERCLERDPRFERAADDLKAVWYLRDDAKDAGTGEVGGKTGAAGGKTAPAGPDTRGRIDAMQLRAWQAEAFAAWSQTGCGVVEAVTGTGKTRLAMAAIRAVVDRGARVLVLVPTLDLLDQWVRELRALVPDLQVGRLGGGHDDDLFANHVVVATPHSAAAVPVDLPPGARGLLIADEAHRYGAPTWGAALHDVFEMRLALTATYERGDDGLVDVLEPYFGEVVMRYGYDRAVAEGTVAPFRIALVGVRLTDAERERYDAADHRARQLHRELVGGLGMPREPKALFAAVAAVVSDADRGGGREDRGGGREDRGGGWEDRGGGGGPQVRACREYLVRVRERRDVAATASGKLEVCRAAAAGLAGRRTLAFTDTVDQAEDAARVLTRAGCTAETVHGGLATDKRRIRLAQFRRGRLDVVVAPRVLDEGVDVPAADVAIVLAAFRTRRQMVQRLGRVLRVKPDGGEARLVLAHAVDTAEDPAGGGHRDFLAQVRSVAREIRDIDVDRAPADLGDWLQGDGLEGR